MPDKSYGVFSQDTKPFEGQKPGTSGLRKKVSDDTQGSP